MNRTAFTGIKAMLIGLGLALALHSSAVARTPGNDQPVGEPGPALTLLPGPGIQDVPPPPTPAPGVNGTVTDRPMTDQVPTALPLPPRESDPATSRAPSNPASPASQPGQGANATQSTSAARGTRPPAGREVQAAPNGGSQPPEIQFDRDGLISMHTNELEVRQLLELISRRSGMNILVSPKVTGTITANFEKVTVDDLLHSVLRLADLVEKTDNGIRFIYSRGEIKDEAETAKKERIVTKVYRLNYVRADELMVMLAPFLSEDVGRKRFATTANYQFGISEASTLATGGMSASGGGAVGGGGVGSGAVVSGGAGTIQRGTQPTTGGESMSGNDVLVIQDYESNLKIIDQIVQRLDIQPVQVLIEAVIISVELDKDKQLGVNFAVVDNLGQQLGVIGAGAALNSNVGFTPAQVLTAAGKIAAGTPADPAGFSSATNGIKYGFVSNNITGFVRALETVGSTKILASPRVLVLNKQRAEIQLGARLGFRTLSQNFTSTIQQVQFLNTGTLLRLRPFVSSDGMVRMEIHPERSQGTVVDDLPSATTAELTTNVMVPNGATLVIGGLMEDEDIYQAQGLPGLSRWPVVGHLFGFKQKTDRRRELVVLLTPHIWSADMAGRSTDEMAARPPRRQGAEIRQVAALAPAPSLSGRTTAPRNRQQAPELLSSGLALQTMAGVATQTPKTTSAASPSPVPEMELVPAPDTSEPVTSVTVGSARSAMPVPAPSPAQPAVNSAMPVPAPPPAPSGLVPTPAAMPVPALAPAASRTTLMRTETIDMLGKTELTDTLESMDRPEPSAVVEPRMNQVAAAPGVRVAQPPKIDSMLAPAAFQTTQRHQFESQPVRVELPLVPAPALSPSPVSVSASAGGGVRRHVVAPGEDFASVAQRFYGSPHLAKSLWWANRATVAWPGALVIGSRLVIPPLEQLEQGTTQAQARRPARLDPQVQQASHQVGSARVLDLSATEKPRTTSEDASPGSENPAADSGFTIHVVQRGETLKSIAHDRLGDERRSAEISELNQDLLTSGSTLTPGMRLLLPSDAQPMPAGLNRSFIPGASTPGRPAKPGKG